MRRHFALVFVVCAALVSTAARAEDDLGLDDLGAAAEVDPALEAKVQAHLARARKAMDRGAYAEAREALDAADRLVPMHEDVLDALDQLGALEDEARRSKDLVKRLETERAEAAAREAEASADRRKVDDEVAEVTRRRGLPRRLDRAIVALVARQETARRHRSEAERARDKCIAAAALAHAAAGARRCKAAEEKVDATRDEVRALDADLAVLTTTYRDRKGEAALKRLLGD